MITKGLLVLGSAIPAIAGALVQRQSTPLDDCPGYTASNVQNDGSRVTADLSLAGTACNAYSEDLFDLKLEVEYQTGTSLALSTCGQDAKFLQQRTDSMLRFTTLLSKSTKSRNPSGPVLPMMKILTRRAQPCPSPGLTARSHLPFSAGRQTRRCSTPLQLLSSLRLSISG